jgi:hypothetical protein
MTSRRVFWLLDVLFPLAMQFFLDYVSQIVGGHHFHSLRPPLLTNFPAP